MWSTACTVHKTPIVPRFFALYRQTEIFRNARVVIQSVNICATLSQKFKILSLHPPATPRDPSPAKTHSVYIKTHSKHTSPPSAGSKTGAGLNSPPITSRPPLNSPAPPHNNTINTRPAILTAIKQHMFQRASAHRSFLSPHPLGSAIPFVSEPEPRMPK